MFGMADMIEDYNNQGVITTKGQPRGQTRNNQGVRLVDFNVSGHYTGAIN